MNILKRYFALICSLAVASLPAVFLCIPAVREYVVDTWEVAAFYSTTIIILYLIGCSIVVFSFIQIFKCVNVLRSKNATQQSFLLGNANKIVFSPSHGLDDDTIDTLYESMDSSVLRKQNQSLSVVTTCASIATMVGLLGTFAGLSMTIASVITLLEKSQMTGGDEDMLAIIVNIVSSLSEPLKGMNTAFVSSIYGVLCSVLLAVICSFLRGEFSRLAIDLRDARLDFVREKYGRKAATVERVKTLRVITDLDDVLKEFKAGMFDFQERIAASCKSSNESLNALLNCTLRDAQLRDVFTRQVVDAQQQQLASLNNIDRGISLNQSALVAIEDEVGATSQMVSGQSAQMAMVAENQTQLSQKQQQLLEHAASSKDVLEEIAQSQTQTEQAVNTVTDTMNHVESSMTMLSTSVERNLSEQNDRLVRVCRTVEAAQDINQQQHIETLATIESQSQTFEPMLGQIAGMHRNLQKEINIIKGNTKNEN